MNKLEHVHDGNAENFHELVIQNSRRGTVLVNYWTPNAGPCFKLWQVLERLSIEYRGRFLLVNINTDTQKRLARENGITSVPTVKIYRQGEVVESVYGAQSEVSLRTIIDNHVPPARDTGIAQAIRAYQAGDVDKALATLVETSQLSPDDDKPHATALKLLLREKRFADIDTWYSALPERLRRLPEISHLQAHARMLYLAELAEPAEQLEKQLEQTPDDMQTLMKLAAINMVDDRFEPALDYLLTGLQADRSHEDELPRRAMLAIFSLLGDQHETTAAYQKRLRDLLH
jgi:putative thioredoxin